MCRGYTVKYTEGDLDKTNGDYYARRFVVL